MLSTVVSEARARMNSVKIVGRSSEILAASPECEALKLPTCSRRFFLSLVYVLHDILSVILF